MLHTGDGPKTIRNGDRVEIFHQIYDTVDFDGTLYTKYLVEIDLDDHIQGVFGGKTVYDMQIKIEGGTITLGRENQLNNGTILRTDTNTVWEDLYVDVQLVRESWDDYEGDNVQWLSNDDVPCDVSYYEPPFYDILDLDIFYHGSVPYIVSNGNLSLNEGWYKNGMGLVTLKNTKDGSVPEYYIPIAVGSAEYNDKETRVGLTAPSFATIHFGFPYTHNILTVKDIPECTSWRSHPTSLIRVPCRSVYRSLREAKCYSLLVVSVVTCGIRFYSVTKCGVIIW